MTSVLVLLVLLAWVAGAVPGERLPEAARPRPDPAVVCQLRPGAVALYLAVAIVAWPAALAAKTLSDLADWGRK
ncbi:hypothetical protein ACIP8U_34945 [Streptomyces pseudovenezuelae]|uniref:hypothetical protein n=1 Tax=Streptomyces pseudovenezuelae TaxID=67350 RepID=UPI0037FDE4BB